MLCGGAAKAKIFAKTLFFANQFPTGCGKSVSIESQLSSSVDAANLRILKCAGIIEGFFLWQCFFFVLNRFH